MIKTLNRRDFLKATTLLSAGSLLAPLGLTELSSLLPGAAPEDRNLGRVLFNQSPVHDQANLASPVLRELAFNDVVSRGQQLVGSLRQTSNETWFPLSEGGYIQSVNLQPVQRQLQEPLTEINTYGQLAEVTMPFTTAFVPKRSHLRKNNENQIFYYGSTHWVYGLGKDAQERYYYLVKEDRWLDSYYVDATHMRVLDPAELQPISPDVEPEKKLIRIYLQDQYLSAYEDDKLVFVSPLSSGQLSGAADRRTPVGSFKINYKRPSRHMVHSDRTGINDNALYGVPWVSYFTDSGIAFHGTYWHNDFSQPKSHGCINLPITAAHWIYLWTTPVVPPREKTYISRYGTRVDVLRGS